MVWMQRQVWKDAWKRDAEIREWALLVGSPQLSRGRAAVYRSATAVHERRLWSQGRGQTENRELFEDDKELSNKWFKCKVAFITLDERNGIEKRKVQTMMVQASYFRNAVKRLDKVLEGTLADYEIVSVSETAIMDVFHYKGKEASHGEWFHPGLVDTGINRKNKNIKTWTKMIF